MAVSTHAMRGLVFVLAVARGQQICVSDTSVDPLVYHCALCRNSSTYLGGDGVTYHIGGNYNGKNDMITCPPEGPTRKTFVVASGVTVTTVPGAPTYIFGNLEIVGSDVTVNGGTYLDSISVIGPDATNVKLHNIDVVATSNEVAVRAYRHHETAKLLDIDGLEVIPASANTYALALAHTTDSDVTVTCHSTAQRVLTQPVVPMTRISSTCEVTDLGQMLSFYGSAYEINFYNWEYKDDSPLLQAMVKWLAIGDAVLLFLLGTCHSSQASSVRVKAI